MQNNVKIYELNGHLLNWFTPDPRDFSITRMYCVYDFHEQQQLLQVSKYNE